MSDEIAGVVLTAYREVLNNPELSAEDDFFDSGGDSIAAVAVSERIAAHTPVAVPMAYFFIYPTAEELARAVAELATAGTPQR